MRAESRTSGFLAAALAGLVALCAAAVTGGLVAPAHAQTAGETLRDATPAPQDASRAPLPATPAGPPAIVTTEGGFVLRRVEVAGATAVPLDTLAAAWAARLGTEVSLTEAAALATAVQTAYRDAGFVFTRVIADAPGDGVLRLTVVEARIDVVEIEEPDGPIGPLRTLMERIAAPLVGLENPSLAALERVLLLMNDTPGVTRATAVPRPGDGGLGSLALSINVSRTPVSGSVFLNTRQQPAFGEGLAGALVEFGGYSAAGDTTRIIGTTSFWDTFDDLKERRLIVVEHERQIGGDGLTITGRALYGLSRPGADLAALDIDGEDVEVGVAAEYPLIRTRPTSLWLRGGFEWIESELDISAGAAAIDNDKRRMLYAEAEALLRDVHGYTAATLGVRKGLDLFGASEKGDPDLSRTDAEPTAAIVYGELERDLRLSQEVSLYALARGQWASAPLMGGEEFSLGGTTFGRGYDPAEVLADHGVGATVELRWRRPVRLSETPLTVELYAFGDVGRVWSAGDGAPDVESLASIGAGVRAIIDGRALVGLEVANPTERLQRTGDDKPRLFLTAQMRF